MEQAHKLVVRGQYTPIIDVIEQLLRFICARPVSPINLHYETVLIVKNCTKIRIAAILLKLIWRVFRSFFKEDQGAKKQYFGA